MTLAKLTQLNIEITTRCTAGCYICPRKVIDRKNKDMSVDDVLDIVNQAWEMGVRKFGPHLLGEPTMHPQYTDILYSLRKKYPTLFIKEYTNGYGFSNSRIIRAMLDALDTVVISVDGAKHETMLALRPGLNPVVLEEEIKEFCKAKHGEKPKIVMRMTVLDSNKDEKEMYRKKWGPLVDVISFIGLSKYMDDGLEEEVAIRENLPCDRIFFHAVVDVNKNVVLCCEDVIPNCILGNLNNNTLEEIWFGEKMEKVRELHLSGKSNEIPICKVCTHKGYY